MSRFCSAPWINISTDVNGSIRPCCRYAQPGNQKKYKMPYMKDGTLDVLYNGQEMKNLRKAFLNGEEPEECNWCWREESAGIKSFRMKYNSKFKLDYSNDNPMPQTLEMKLSNVCNLKCRMCSPVASSSIAKEMKVFNPYHVSNKILSTDNESIFFEKILPGVSFIELTGGEPFYSEENRKLIELISDTKYCENIWLYITTNGMFHEPKILEKMKKYKKVTIAFSVDDVGQRLEYARSNSNWETIKKNIFYVRDMFSNFKIFIHRTVNNFNVYYLDELDDWAKRSGVDVFDAFLHEPEYLSIQNLSSLAKNEIELKLDNKHESVIDFMNDGKPNVETLLSFQKQTKFLDNLRKESFEKIYPEWAEILIY